MNIIKKIEQTEVFEDIDKNNCQLLEDAEGKIYYTIDIITGNDYDIFGSRFYKSPKKAIDKMRKYFRRIETLYKPQILLRGWYAISDTNFKGLNLAKLREAHIKSRWA